MYRGFPVLIDTLYYSRTRVNHELGHFTGPATFGIRKTEGFGNLLLLLSNQVLDSLPSCNLCLSNYIRPGKQNTNLTFLNKTQP